MNLIVSNYVLGNDLNGMEDKFDSSVRIAQYRSGDRFFPKFKIIFLPIIESLFGNGFIHIYECPTRLLNIRFPGQVNIYLSHGWGVKRSPGILEVQSKRDLSVWRTLRKSTDYVICYSNFDSTYFFNHELLNDLPLPEFIPLGHPRNDFLVRMKDNTDYLEKQRKRLGIPYDSKIILFAPTHREPKTFDGFYDKQLLELHIRQFEEIDKVCAERNLYILYRPHYLVSKSFKTDFSNIIFVTSEKEPDPRPLMLISDILITDYSSIYVDYLLLEKPLVFYQPDLELYQNTLRGLVVDPNNPVHFPGPRISKLQEIFELSENDLNKFDLKASKNFFHRYSDDKALERIANFLKENFYRK
ncbi:MAG TPA: CDP-glycerol glycerophosphotransferase family protein [Candidatus Dojkabacteria bacterium]|mgnify:CR=1 FL=1|nr:CDP-glycerol glycerophosphotransferase family protein [Candidatus Dojkabacteria bacterium]